MDNLHRSLAPISRQAWAEIEEEATRTLRRHLAGRRVVDVSEPHGLAFSAVTTGRNRSLPAGDGVVAHQREVLPLVEVRVPFTISREEADAVARGAADADWQPVKDAARAIAFAEDRAIFDGYKAAAMTGMRPASSNKALRLPARASDYPAVIADALNALRLAGVNGPYAVVLGAQAYEAAMAGDASGYPVIRHLEQLVDAKRIVWAPAVEGVFVVSTRGGDFSLDVGQDVSIGYQSHTDRDVTLYLQETFAFRVLSEEAVVAINHGTAGRK